jgi:hypothetical protein
MNYRQVIARQKKAEDTIYRHFKYNPNIQNKSGIYVLKRTDEAGIKYAYIGQAKKTISRLGQHLLGYQHIDLSLKKYGLYDKEKNPYGYIIEMWYFKEEDLDEKERLFIKNYADHGYQLRNKTAGGQDKGKIGIDDNKPSRGYYDGKKQGRVDTIKEIKTFFDKYLDYSIKGQPNKIKERKLQEFGDLLNENLQADEELNEK